MPKPRTRQRWEHPLYKEIYCVERNGKVYGCVQGRNAFLLHPVMIWDKSNKRKALDLLAQSYLANQNTASDANIPVTIFQAWTKFEEIIFPKLSRETIKSYYSCFNNYLIRDLQLSDVQAIRELILERKKILQAGTYTTRTRGNKEKKEYTKHGDYVTHKYLGKLHKFFEFCIEFEYMTKNPVLMTMKPPKPKAKKLIYTSSEVKQILDYIRSSHYITYNLNGKEVTRSRREFEDREQLGLFYEFLSLTAVRGGEALKLRWDYDIKEDYLIIDGKRQSISEPKIREIPFSLIPGLQEIINKLSKFRFINKGRLFKWKYLQTPEKQLQNILKTLQMERRTVHSFRSYALWNMENILGLPPNVIDAIAGQTIAVRRKYYRPEPTAKEIIDMYNAVRFQ